MIEPLSTHFPVLFSLCFKLFPGFHLELGGKKSTQRKKVAMAAVFLGSTRRHLTLLKKRTIIKECSFISKNMGLLIRRQNIFKYYLEATQRKLIIF